MAWHRLFHERQPRTLESIRYRKVPTIEKCLLHKRRNCMEIFRSIGGCCASTDSQFHSSKVPTPAPPLDSPATPDKFGSGATNLSPLLGKQLTAQTFAKRRRIFKRTRTRRDGLVSMPGRHSRLQSPNGQTSRITVCGFSLPGLCAVSLSEWQQGKPR